MPHKWVFIPYPENYGKQFVGGLWYHCAECDEWINGSNNATPDVKCRLPWDLQEYFYSGDASGYDAIYSCEDIQVMRVQGA